MRFFRCFALCFLAAALFPGPAYASSGSIDSLVPGITDFLVHVVVPREDYWSEQYDSLSSKLGAKLPYMAYIDAIRVIETVASGGAGFSDVELPYNGSSIVLPLSMANPYLGTVQLIIKGIFTFLLAYFNYRQILFLVRGATHSPIGGGGG